MDRTLLFGFALGIMLGGAMIAGGVQLLIG